MRITTPCYPHPHPSPSPRLNPNQTAESTHAYFLLMQPDPKMSGATDRGGDEGGPKYDMKIGMYIMRGKVGMMRKVLYDSEEIEGDDVVDSTPYMEYREVHTPCRDLGLDLGPHAPRGHAREHGVARGARAHRGRGGRPSP